MAGVINIMGFIALSLRDLRESEQLQSLQSSRFVDVVTGTCLKQDTPCSCICPGRANCEEKSGIQRCLKCPSSASYCSSPCLPNAVEHYDRKRGKVECRCRCADFSVADSGRGGLCKVTPQARQSLFMSLNSDCYSLYLLTVWMHV